MKSEENKKGLTPQELVFATTVMLILAAVIIVLIDPPMRFKQAREAKRFADVDNMIDAIRLYQIDHSGDLFPEINEMDPSSYYMIGTCETGASTACEMVDTEDACVDINTLVDAEYMDDVPSDPLTGSREKTNYYIRKTYSGRVIVGACNPELSTSIRRRY